MSGDANEPFNFKRPECPRCHSMQTFFRKRTKDWTCRYCGNEFVVEQKPSDGGGSE